MQICCSKMEWQIIWRVITAQSNVLQSELNLMDIERQQLSAMVDLYRSLRRRMELVSVKARIVLDICRINIAENPI